MIERRITLVETELTDAPIVTLDLAKIGEALAAMPCSPYKGTHIAHGEWTDIVNAVWFACDGSEEGFRLADEWSKPWFYYSAVDLRTRWDNCAKFPPQGFDANTLFKLAAKKAEREATLEEAALLSDEDYEEQRGKLADKAGKWRVGKLDEERKRRRKRGAAYTAPPAPKPTVEQLAEAAKDIIASEDVLGLFAKSISHRLAGESAAAQLIYLCGTSRLFDEPMNVVIKGQSAIGKSHLFDSVFHYMPPEDVFSFTTLTEKALIYLQDDLKHKILRVAEAVGVGKERETTDYILREIITNHRITHWVVVAAAPGEVPVTRRVDKEGPVMFATTTTKAELHPELETRILSVEIDDTQKQTRRVLLKIAQTREIGRASCRERV